jgi:uncharacterized protein YuzE
MSENSKSDRPSPVCHYDAETDALYIKLGTNSSVDSDEITDGVVVDFGANGKIVGLDVDLSLLRAILEKKPSP